MATPVFACGAECGVFAATAHWAQNSGTAATFSTATVRSGARSLRFNPTTNTSVINPIVSGTVARFYVNFATLPSADTTIVAGGTSQVRFKQSDSKLYAYDSGGATFGASGIAVTTGVWYCIDMKADTGAGTLDLQVDGVAIAQKSTPGNNSITVWGISNGSATADLFMDDFVFSNTLADYPIGAGNVYHFIPTSDGTHNVAGAADFQRTLTGTDILNATTTAFQLIDDVPLESGASVDWINMIAPPNATDYVECIFGPASGISTPTVAPRAVEVIAGYHQAGTGTGNMEIRMNDNGTTNVLYTATTVAGVTSVAYARKHYATAPTGGAWTVAAGAGNFNNLRVRFGSPAVVDVNPDQYLDCIMVEAEFAPAAGGRTTKNTRAWPLGTEIGMNWRTGGV